MHRGFISTAARPILLTTTDIRTPKARQISQNANVELAWWFAGAQEQYRIKGKAWILPSREAGGLDQAGSDVRDNACSDSMKAVIQATARELLKTFPAERLSGTDVNFDWEKKRQEVFENIGAHMRATWARPVPGSKLEGGCEEARKWPEKLRNLSEIAEGEDGEEGMTQRHASTLCGVCNAREIG